LSERANPKRVTSVIISIIKTYEIKALIASYKCTKYKVNYINFFTVSYFRTRSVFFLSQFLETANPRNKHIVKNFTY